MRCLYYSLSSSTRYFTIGGSNSAVTLPNFRVSSPNSACSFGLMTKSVITSGNGGDESKVSVDWYPNAGDANTATAISF